MPVQPTLKKPTNGETARTLADVLVEQAALAPDRASQVKLAEIQSGKTQEEIIINQKLVSEEALVRAKAALYNIPFVDVSTIPASPEALSVLSQEVAERFKVFPVSMDKVSKTLVLAMADPLDLTAIEFIEQKTGLHIKPAAAVPSKIMDSISTRFTSSLSQEVTAALKEVAPEEKIKTFEAAKTGIIREEKVSEIVSHILDFAMKARASDVHVEPQ
jgi:type IV pilus assembly protein PilB